MTRWVKMQPWGVIGEKLLFRWTTDQYSAKRGKMASFLGQGRVWPWDQVRVKVEFWLLVRVN